jgi:hypothetical protein
MVALAAAGVLAAGLSGALPGPAPILCLAALALRLAPPFSRDGGLPGYLLVPSLAGLFALTLGHAWGDFPRALLLFAAPFLVLRAFASPSSYNDFLIVLGSLLAMVGGAALAPGPLALGLVAGHIAVTCLSLPHLVRIDGEEGDDPSMRVRVAAARPAARVAAAAAPLLAGAIGIPLGALLFLVLPRSASPGQDDPGPGGSRELREARAAAAALGSVRTGFSGASRLNAGMFVRDDPRPALTAHVSREGAPYDPVGAEALLRGGAWDVYDPETRAWRRSGAGFSPVDGAGAPRAGDPPIHWRIRLADPDADDFLFVPPLHARVRGVAAEVDPLGNLRRRGPGREYSVEALLVPRATGALRVAEPEPRLLALPASLAAALCASLPPHDPRDPLGSIDALRALFLGGSFRYVRRIEATPPGRDPILDFLERRTGHCELFASAACLMLRAMRVPARYAGGLNCVERTARGELRASWSDAHAWVEVPFQGVGFVPIEFTPSAARGESDAPGQEVLPEAKAREGGGGRAGPFWRDPFRYGRAEQRRLYRALGDGLKSLPWLLMGAGAVALLLAAAARAALRARRVGPLAVTAPPGVARRTLGFYARWLRRCASRGHRRRPSQTPREFLAALPPQLAAEGAAITAEFERRRYGGAGPAAPQE